MEAFCQKCGRPLKPGDLAYQVRIELTSMPDGYIEEPDEDIDLVLERLIEAVSSQDPEQAGKDVAQTIVLIMCRKCRNKLVKDYDVDQRVLH